MVSSGYLQFYQRNYVSAEKIFSKVLALNPDYKPALTRIGHFRLGKHMPL